MYSGKRSNSYRIRSGITLAIAPASAAASIMHAMQKANWATYQLQHISALSSNLLESRLGLYECPDSTNRSTRCHSNIGRIHIHANHYPYFSEAIKPRKNRGVALFFLLILRASEFCDHASEACRNSRTTIYRYGAPAHD